MIEQGTTEQTLSHPSTEYTRGLLAAVFDAAGAAVGQAITVVAALIDVTTVVIGGGVTRAWHLLEPAIRRCLGDEPPVSGLPIRLERSAPGTDAVALGAASRVCRELDHLE